MHVVFGANGRAGGDTARALIERGEAVRVALRRPEQGEAWAALGAEVAIADFDDPASLSAALRGARSAFLLCPPPMAGDPFARAAAIGAALAAAIRRAGLPKAVLLSSVGAQLASGTGIIATLYQVEAALAGAAPSLAFLRPGYFVETWEEVAVPAMTQGVLPSFLDPDLQIPMVSTMDVGAEAARLMCEEWSGRRIVELSGREERSANEVAAAFSEVLGRPVQAVPVPTAERAAVLAAAGVPQAVADALLGMYDGIASGRVAGETGSEQRRGTTSLIEAVDRIVAKVRAAH